MMTALILVCSITTVSNMGECPRGNALDIMYVPTTLASPVSCLMHAQAYLADHNGLQPCGFGSVYNPLDCSTSLRRHFF